MAWVGVTIPNAGEIRAFCQQVAGWKAREMDGDDEMIQMTTNAIVAEVRYYVASTLSSPQWLISIVVENLKKRIAASSNLGGSVVDGSPAIHAELRGSFVFRLHADVFCHFISRSNNTQQGEAVLPPHDARRQGRRAACC